MFDILQLNLKKKKFSSLIDDFADSILNNSHISKTDDTTLIDDFADPIFDNLNTLKISSDHFESAILEYDERYLKNTPIVQLGTAKKFRPPKTKISSKDAFKSYMNFVITNKLISKKIYIKPSPKNRSRQLGVSSNLDFGQYVEVIIKNRTNPKYRYIKMCKKIRNYLYFSLFAGIASMFLYIFYNQVFNKYLICFFTWIFCCISLLITIQIIIKDWNNENGKKYK